MTDTKCGFIIFARQNESFHFVERAYVLFKIMIFLLQNCMKYFSFPKSEWVSCCKQIEQKFVRWIKL